MKLKRLMCVLLLLIAVAIHLPAQESDLVSKYFKETKARAEKGDAAAQFNLGVCYFDGEGVAKDAAEAVKWYRKAADQNDASAQCNLGFCYNNGHGLKKDAVQAVKWYRKAAEQNIALAQLNLGICYVDGQGVERDATLAVQWYHKAAVQGYALAQFALGVCYADGQGVEKNSAEAMKWYRKAADQNDAPAQFALGYCYSSGEGVTKDAGEAVKWYRKAANQGSAPAQFNLGVCYANGQGVAKDVVEATKWLRKAADQGVAAAQQYLRALDQNPKGEGKVQTEADQNQAKQPFFGKNNQPNLPEPKNVIRRPLTKEELRDLDRHGFDVSSYDGREVEFPNPQPQHTPLTPTPDDLKDAILYLDKFLGVSHATIPADVISMKTGALKFRFAAQDFEYSGDFTVVLNKPRQYNAPYFGFGSLETAKLVMLLNFRGISMPLPEPTIVTKINGFIDVLSGGKEWIYSGSYLIQK